MGVFLSHFNESFRDYVSIIKIILNKNQPFVAKYPVKGVPIMNLFNNGPPFKGQSGVIH